MNTGLYTIPNSSINIQVMNIIKVENNSTTMNVVYLTKSNMVLDFEVVTISNDKLNDWIKLEE